MQFERKPYFSPGLRRYCYGCCRSTDGRSCAAEKNISLKDFENFIESLTKKMLDHAKTIR